jgi:cytochrome c oxidase assembly factor CtaG
MSHPGVAANGITQPLIEAWTLDPWVVAPLALAAGIYLRGWLRLHAQAPRRFGAERLAAFLGGLAAIAVALESPLHALGAQLLQAHMGQHLLLMMVAPPLLWLGAPLLPVLHGLPRHLLHTTVGRLFAWPPLTHIGQWLVRLPVAWLVFVASTWAWHSPALYERALASELWHDTQHACFLATALAFWWPVVQPWPSRPLVPPWAIVLYLLLADLQNTVLSAWLVFSERLIYSAYNAVPRPWQISALDDQAAAGAIMWVPGSVAFLLPVAWIVGQMLSPQRHTRYARKGHHVVTLSPQQVVDDGLRLGSRDEGETW